MIEEIKCWRCNVCGYISYFKILSCPSCSYNNKNYTITINDLNIKDFFGESYDRE